MIARGPDETDDNEKPRHSPTSDAYEVALAALRDASDFGPGRCGGDHRGSASAPDSIALKVISMSCAGKASLVTPIRLLAH